MSDHTNPPQQHHGFMAAFFSDMPAWARAMVFGLCAIPVAVAISGLILNVNVGTYLDTYMEIQLEQMRNVSQQSTEEIIVAINAAVDARFVEIERQIEDLTLSSDQKADALLERVRLIEGWACGPVFHDGNPVNDPEFCQ